MPRTAPARLLAGLLVLPGCPSQRDGAPAPPAVASSARSATSAPSVGSPSSAGPDAAAVNGEVGKAIDAWLEAQTKGDVKGYLAAYDEATFTGKKRTREGGEKSFAFPAWKADREKMLKHKPKVVAESRAIETWLDGKLAKDTVRATFIQRFRSGSYADHGKKALTLLRAADGSYRITREEMLTSSPGFDDASATSVREIDHAAWTGPIVATLTWQALPGKAKNPDLQPPCHLVLTLSDASGKRDVVELYRESETDRVATLGPVKPATKPGMLFEEGFWWAGAGDYFRVVVDAERIVVKHKVEDEGSPEVDPVATIYEDQARVAIPKGAKVEAR
jgi:hypothetical protein